MALFNGNGGRFLLNIPPIGFFYIQIPVAHHLWSTLVLDHFYLSTGMNPQSMSLDFPNGKSTIYWESIGNIPSGNLT